MNWPLDKITRITRTAPVATPGSATSLPKFEPRSFESSHLGCLTVTVHEAGATPVRGEVDTVHCQAPAGRVGQGQRD
jgi:hypothetical protein